MARFLLSAIKTVIILSVLWHYISWLNTFLPWANKFKYMEDWKWPVVALKTLSVVTISVAVYLLSTSNFLRVIRNTILILFCTAVGWICGDPLSRGTYDHGGGESEIGWMTGSTWGALIAYGITHILYTISTNRKQILDKSLSEEVIETHHQDIPQKKPAS